MHGYGKLMAVHGNTRLMKKLIISKIFIINVVIMRNKIMSLFLMFFASVGMMMAQTQVRGHVSEESGEPIIGVSIQIKGTGQGTITDIDGNFELSAPRNAVLIFSYVGMKTIEMPASANMRVVMKPDAEILKEVVVVGYGTQRKENLTGAVSSVNVEEALGSRPVTDIAKALQGVSPGLTITNNVGGIGTESTIKLRGSQGSINASAGTSPLILVDGVEVPSLNLINPNDIQSISVLKDAASASIYGTRAAWGVILITTKEGREGAPRVSYSNNFAWNTPTRMPELMSTVENAEYMFTVAKRDAPDKTVISSIGYSVDKIAIEKMKAWQEKYGSMSQDELGEMMMGRDFEVRDGATYFYRSFDPIEMFARKWSPQQNHDFSISGGTAKTSYNIGMGYLTQKGVMKINTDEYERYNLTSNITTTIKDWWKVRTNLMFSRTNDSQPYKYTSGQYDAWFYLMRWPRWYPYTTYEGRDFRSAVTDLKQANRETVNTNFVRANIGTELIPLPNLSINFDYTFGLWNRYQKRNGGDVAAYDMFSTNPLVFNTSLYGATHNRALQTSQYMLSNIFKVYGTYNFNLNDTHNFKFIAGFDAETRERLGHYSERRDLIDNNMPEIALATGDQYSFNSSYSYMNDFAAAGFFGRINYDYKHKYLFELNARYDGSSKFPAGNKWALFPSASAGWRLSEEAFMEWARPVVSNFKLRGSWGTIGNQDVASNSFISTMSSGNSGWVMNGKNVLYLGAPSVLSPDLTWERVTTYDIGFDAGFFDNRLNVVFDWYKRITSDMHTAGETLPSTFGATAPKINFGELTATGVELGVNYQHQFENGLGMSLSASMSNVKEVITKFNADANNIYSNYIGKELGEIWGYETDRLFQESDFNADGSLKDGIPSQSLYESGAFKFGPGDVKYKDLNGDGKISYGSNTLEDHGDLKVIGNSLPRMEYNFGGDFNYKNVDLRFFFQGVGKRDYWAFGAVAIPTGGSGYAESAFKHQLDYWTPDNTDAFYPRPSNNAWISNGNNFLRQTRFLQNMAYLRLKNITLGYKLPQSWMQAVKFTSARIYVSGENLFEFQNMTIPIDPESTDYKTGYGSGSWSFGRSYPYSRTFSVGMQLQF